jgi:hypothetical protein
MLAECWWLTPVILCIWEAEIRRIAVPAHPREKFTRPTLKVNKLGVVACICQPTDGGELKIAGLWCMLA